MPGSPTHRPVLGALLGCLGMLCFPAACLVFWLMDPPTAWVTPGYPMPTRAEKIGYLLTALTLAGAGYVALRVGLSWGREPEPDVPAPPPPELDEETAARVRRHTLWITGAVGLVGTVVWVSGFLLGRHAPREIRVRDGGELVIALVQHALLTAVVAWVAYVKLRQRARGD